MMTQWIERAKKLGFDEAKTLRIETLKPMQEVRDMCAADKCRAYGKNWTCPPACGSLEKCAEKIKKYHSGILLQTVGKMNREIDYRAMVATEERHLQLFHQFCNIVREKHPDALCLGAGGCRICKKCAYPEKCRFPKEACSSMEAYGLFVTQVCKDNGMAYYYGAKMISYTACVLID